jgi:DNA mismatch endonuclease, patch repair protein
MMAAVRSKDTQPEMLVRRLLHSMGYRYRLHRSDLPGKPDIVLPGRRKVIFVHGCFWHQHEGCKSSHLPKSNSSYWLPKLERNRARDAEHLKVLSANGWEHLVLWECELKEPGWLRQRLCEFLD